MANNRKNDEIILASLLSTPTIRAAAAACGVSESVIYSRLKDPEFKERYDRERREILAFNEFHRGQNKIRAIECTLDETEKLDELIGRRLRETLTDDIELLDGAGYLVHLDVVDSDEQVYTDEAYNAGEFDAHYSGAANQLSSYTITCNVLSVEMSRLLLF